MLIIIFGMSHISSKNVVTKWLEDVFQKKKYFIFYIIVTHQNMKTLWRTKASHESFIIKIQLAEHFERC